MSIHLPAETALALAMALTDARYDLHAKRTAAEKAIEDLIDFLDDTESDPDLEALGDENDCSWPEGCRLFGALCEDDEDDDAGEDDGCAEPSLGAPEARSLPVDYFYSQRTVVVQSGPSGSQEHWAQGGSKDLEENVEDEGEAVNEDGGDILDEPHDEMDEGDLEPDLCFGGVPEFDGPTVWKDERDRPTASMFVARALRLARNQGKVGTRDPDELTIIAPGVVRIGVR